MSAMSRDERFALLEQEPFRESRSRFDLRSQARAVADVFSNRELLVLLVRRDVRARYKDSVFGMLWALIRPMAQLIIYYVVIGQFLGAARGIPNFTIYVYSGIAVYTLFSEIVGGATHSIVNNSGLVKKVQLPREIFPIASAGSALFNFSIQLVILAVFAMFAGGFGLWPSLGYLLLAVSVIVLYGLVFGIGLAAANVYLRDIGHLVDVVLMLLMWASPVVYSLSMVQQILGTGAWFQLYLANPVTLGVVYIQQAFWPGAGELPPSLLPITSIVIVVGVLLLAGSHAMFRRVQGSMAQEL